MTRSNIFYYNALSGYVLIALYTAFFLFIKRCDSCLSAPRFYSNINLMIYAFSIRLAISFLNYHFYFKYLVNEADVANAAFYIDYSNRVSPDIIELIETHVLGCHNFDKLIQVNDENERDVCCICMGNFNLDDSVKVLPCNDKHIFHKGCIEKWLTHNKACPTCRKEVNRKSVEKVKMF